MGTGALIGLGAAAVAATGALFLYGTKEGAKTRKKITALALKVKGDVLAELERAKDMSEKTYHDAIEKVSRRYAGLKNIDQKELVALVQELKGHWRTIQKEMQQGMKKTTTAAKKVVRAHTRAKKH